MIKEIDKVVKRLEDHFKAVQECTGDDISEELADIKFLATLAKYHFKKECICSYDESEEMTNHSLLCPERW